VIKTEPQPAAGAHAPLQDALQGCEDERRRLLAQPFTPAASRALEAVDELSGRIWEALEEIP
jgi:hypothetical protein